MATFEKRGGTWRARIIRRGLGIDESASFPLKSQAQAWATKREAEILAGARGFSTGHTVADAIDRFIRDVAPKRAGARWEIVRLTKFRRHKLALKPLSKLTTDDMARWRDERLGAVSPSSVAREMNLWAALFSIAVSEWRWIGSSPIRGVRRPIEPPARRRGVHEDEIAVLVQNLDGTAGRQVKTAFLLAIETGMRAGEILGLTWDHVDLQRRVVTLPKTKNGDSRQVPLSSLATAILRDHKPRGLVANEKNLPVPLKEPLLTITPATLDTLFRRARDAAIPDCPSIATLHFHDSRSEAISRLSKRLDVLELARVVGHRNLSSLMFYYRADAEELAKKLD